MQTREAKALSSFGQSFKTEMKDLVDRICAAGEEIDCSLLLRERGHMFGHEYADLRDYMNINSEKCFEELFPDLNNTDDYLPKDGCVD